MVEHLTQIAQIEGSREAVDLQMLGKSYEGRDIFVMRIGSGPTKVALWSQMHGDEPTHTVALIELLRWLTSRDALANSVLQSCSLTIVPMLNPDGAENWTRRNAQGIDINRDARRLVSPEAKLLDALILRGKFDFAFNLHNQRRSRTIDGQHLAAISLLVPPVDEANSQTEWTQRSKRLASCIRRCVEPRCEQMISRYNAGFMPRCFGERVSASGVATLLVEAGGCPDLDADWLTQLHFHALASGLSAIAEGVVESESPDGYESLPVGNDQELYDLLIRNVTFRDESSNQSVVFDSTDVGIVRSQDDKGRTIGTVTELGDLEGFNGRATIDAGKLVVQPGRIVFDSRLSLDTRPTELMAEAVQLGVTSVVGCVSLERTNDEIKAAFKRLGENQRLLNVGWFGEADVGDSPREWIDVIFRARCLGLFAVVAKKREWTDKAIKRARMLSIVPLTKSQVAKLSLQHLRASPSEFDAFANGLFSGPDHHRPTLGASVDWAMFPVGNRETAVQVLVRGIRVFDDGKVLSSHPGIIMENKGSDVVLPEPWHAW